MATVKKGELFPHELVRDLINKVKGHSSLAVLSKQEPIPFNGTDIFTFNLDGEIDIVAEGGAKSPGGASVGKIMMVPLKVEYSARFSDEFLYASEEYRLNILKAFAEGYAKKLARGLDLMAMHGINPRTNTASEIIGSNHLDAATADQTVTYAAANVDANIEDAIGLVQLSQGVVTGIALDQAAANALSKVAVNGVRQFPDFRFGANPGNLGGIKVDINETVSAFGTTKAYVGDFANQFKWGYAKEINLQVIDRGDPDNSGRDLAGHNEVLLRSETYIGWGILDPTSFARVADA